ncbi:MAG: amino acid ABC transporter substrate-binding protein, partial [Gammaproteobacteria bacterium]|nr:amino acid ABC transporter substrate-binding protein [Gammaproteobacteria bacterium]
MTASLSGQYAAPGDNMLKGLQMWAHDVNGRGALLGRPVEIVYYDDASDPATSASLYERLISEDKVDLLIGPYASDVTIEASSVAERHNFPMVSGSAAASDIWGRGYKNIFQVDAPAEKFMDGLIESASNAGLSRIALAYAGSDFPRAVAAGVRAKAAELNMSLVFDLEYSNGNTDFAGLVRDMKAANPDLVIGGTYLDDSIAFVHEAKRQQFSPGAFAFTVGPALVEFGDKLGPDAEGIMGVVSWMRSGSVPMAYDFSFRYKEKYGRNAGVHAAYGYAAGQVLEAGVRLAGSLDKDAIRQQLGEMRFRSILGNYQVDENGSQLAKNTYVMQWQNGFRLLVLPKTIQDAEVIYPFKPWSER